MSSDRLLDRLAALPPERRRALLASVQGGERTFPLSKAQERLWFLHRYDPADSAYNIVWTMRLRGALDVSALAAALTSVVRRHEVLRTRYRMVGERAAQLVDAPAPVEVERDGELEEFATRPFDLARRGPLRAAVIRTGPREWLFCLVVHHIALDGWSLDTLIGEIAEAYAGRSLEVAETQYRHFVEWERSQDVSAAVARRAEALAGAPPLDLPGTRPARWSGRGGRVRVTVPDEITTRLEGVAKANRATLFMALLAAFETMVFRVSGATDFCVGVPVAGPGRVAFPSLVGCLANTMALRADLSGEPGFADLLRRTRVATLGALQHAAAPYEEVLAAVRPPRDPSRPPLCQVMFNLTHNLPKQRLLSASMGDLEAEVLDPPPPRRAKADLSVELWRGPEGLGGWLEYNADLLDAAAAERLAALYASIVTEETR
ncbi:condensation domain-containing protein [Nonomuraea soli]|uniref:Condensation domain-containing protein n=1 Tax=Nonomuraea soli TaxID=1032476 RepID=A0A7W0HPG5_9ACTN|nr:condensation domain-containing protein [Nonomuraea soli]MBA2890561.1 hypothetical protein [Nonomuraea soli]